MVAVEPNKLLVGAVEVVCWLPSPNMSLPCGCEVVDVPPKRVLVDWEGADVEPKLKSGLCGWEVAPKSVPA